MVMQWLSECADGVSTRWLDTSIYCCRPLAQDRDEQEPSKQLNPSEICYEQPLRISPPKLDFDGPRPFSQHTHHSSWFGEGWNVTPRLSGRMSFASKRSSSRRPTIGAPSDFRRVNLPSGRTGGFRPLELSIYLPGNELPTLPDFNDDALLASAGIEIPKRTLSKSKSDTMLSRTSTAFSIPRKPVPHSRNTSVDSTCASRYPSVISNPQSLRRKSIVETSQSTLDFLNGLDAKLPKSPPPAHARSDSEPVFTLHRRASEQSLRLRAHLEERQEIERRLQDFDTILEEEKQLELDERPFYSPLRMHSTSHMMHDQASRPSQHLPGTRPNRAMTSPELPRSRHVPSPSRSKLIYSSSLAETEQPTKPTMALKPLPVPTELVPSTRSRISQWLWRTVSLKSTDDADSQMDPPSWYHHHPHMTFVPERKASLSTVSSATHVNNALGSPWSTPRSSPHKKGSSSLSSYQTNPSSAPCRALSFDVDVDLEKHPIVTDVGVAF